MTTVEIEEIREVEAAVQNGMKLLDEKFGTTFLDKINPDTLDIGSGINCALGQCYGTYMTGREKLGLTQKQAAAHGFDVSTAGGHDAVISKFRQLTEAWRAALLARSA